MNLVELMVAAFVLMVGMLGVLTMLHRGIATTGLNTQRVAATNLARELVENARATDYDRLTPGQVVAALQEKPGMGAGTPWSVVRRNTTYTVTASACTFDDPADGLAAVAPDNLCSGQGGTPATDPNGDDFRRVTFTLAWIGRGQLRTLTQSALIVNPAGGLGPRITAAQLVPSGTITGGSQAVFKLTSSAAAAVHWNADDGHSAGEATRDDATGTKWTITWDLGTAGTETAVLDGTYTVIAQAFDSRDVPGDAAVANVVINRSPPLAPAAFGGGHDTRAGDWIDLEWSFSPERDVLGYRIYWAGADGTVRTTDDQAVCPGSGSGSEAVLDRAFSACADFSPTAGATDYFAVALDRDANGALREGAAKQLAVPAASTRPDGPSTLTATSAANPVLEWAAPASGTAAGYRIYRDGTDWDDRAGFAPSEEPLTWTDGEISTGSHEYWVTSVDSSFNESDPVGPVSWSAP